MKTNIKPQTSFSVFGREVDVIWSDELDKFIPICFRDNDEETPVAIHVGEYIHYLGKKAGITNNKPGTKKGIIKKLSYPYENQRLQFLVEIDDVDDLLEYQFQSSSEKN